MELGSGAATGAEVVRKWIEEYADREGHIRAAMDRVLETSAGYHGRINHTVIRPSSSPRWHGPWRPESRSGTG
jgi:hypothetical protein